MICLIHGGPHHVFTLDYNPSILFYLNNGYWLLCINYRGSTGFGN